MMVCLLLYIVVVDVHAKNYFTFPISHTLTCFPLNYHLIVLGSVMSGTILDLDSDLFIV